MGLGCGTTIVKYIIFFFNFLIALGGIALVTIGVVSLVTAGDLKGVFDENDPTSVAIILIVFGGIVFLISFFGCCGAIKESHCMTMTYASFLLVILIGQIVIAVIVFVNQEDFKTNILNLVSKIFDSPNNQGNMETIDAIQKGLNCCGWTSSLLWAGQYPSSCCGNANAIECAAIAATRATCKSALTDTLNTYSALLGWIAIGVAAIELVALIFACCLGNNIRNAQRRYA